MLSRNTLNLQNGNFRIQINRPEAVVAFVKILKHYYKCIYNKDTFKSSEIVCGYNNKGIYTVCYRGEKVEICFYDYSKLRNLGIVSVGSNSIDYIIEFLYDNNYTNGAVDCDWCIAFKEEEKDEWWGKLQYKDMKKIYDCMQEVTEKYRKLINERVGFYLKITDDDRNLELNNAYKEENMNYAIGDDGYLIHKSQTEAYLTKEK